MMNQLIIKLFDRYSPILYAISLDFCQSESDAETLLRNTFLRLGQEKTPKTFPATYISLIQLLLIVAKETYPIRVIEKFTIKQFENTPLINQLVCEHITLDSYCQKNNIDRQDALKVLLVEANTIRNKKLQPEVPSNQNGV